MKVPSKPGFVHTRAGRVRFFHVRRVSPSTAAHPNVAIVIRRSRTLRKGGVR